MTALIVGGVLLGVGVAAWDYFYELRASLMGYKDGSEMDAKDEFGEGNYVMKRFGSHIRESYTMHYRKKQ